MAVLAQLPVVVVVLVPALLARLPVLVLLALLAQLPLEALLPLRVLLAPRALPALGPLEAVDLAEEAVQQIQSFSAAMAEVLPPPAP